MIIDTPGTFIPFNNNIRICDGTYGGDLLKSGKYIYGKVLIFNVIFKILKSEALITLAKWFTIKDVEGVTGKIYPAYGVGGQDKFTTSAVTQSDTETGLQYIANGPYYTIPSSYLSQTTTLYYIHVFGVCFYN